MKKVLLAITLFFIVGIAQTSAQAAAPAPAKPKKENFAWIKKYMDEAGIDAELQAKIEAFKKVNDAETKALKADSAVPEEEKKKQFYALAAKRQETIAGMLTEAQKAKIVEIKAAIAKRNEAMKE